MSDLEKCTGSSVQVGAGEDINSLDSSLRIYGILGCSFGDG